MLQAVYLVVSFRKFEFVWFCGAMASSNGGRGHRGRGRPLNLFEVRYAMTSGLSVRYVRPTRGTRALGGSAHSSLTFVTRPSYSQWWGVGKIPRLRAAAEDQQPAAGLLRSHCSQNFVRGSSCLQWRGIEAGRMGTDVGERHP